MLARLEQLVDHEWSGPFHERRDAGPVWSSRLPWLSNPFRIAAKAGLGPVDVPGNLGCQLLGRREGMVSPQPFDEFYGHLLAVQVCPLVQHIDFNQSLTRPNVGLVPMYAIASDVVPSQEARAA